MTESDDGNETTDPARVARRDALRKAAVAAGAAGAVWAAPKVEGLSLAPSYAAAATATAPHEVIITIGTSGDENNVGSGCNPGNHHWAITSLLNSPYAIRNHPTNAGGQLTHTNTPGVTVSGPSRTRGPAPQPKPSSWPSEPTTIYRVDDQDERFTVSAPLGTGVGTVAITNPGGYIDSDLDGEKRFDVTFNVDPPFNKCRVTEAILHACYLEPNGAGNNQQLNSYNALDAWRIADSLGNLNPGYAVRPVVTNPGYNPTNQTNPGATWVSTVRTTNTYPGDGSRAMVFKISCA